MRENFLWCYCKLDFFLCHYCKHDLPYASFLFFTAISAHLNFEHRHCLMQIVEVVLRQGLVHPITCVPYLIALETDPLEVNAKLAHHLLMNMNEK